MPHEPPSTGARIDVSGLPREGLIRRPLSLFPPAVEREAFISHGMRGEE